jgi:hypothetical protein
VRSCPVMSCAHPLGGLNLLGWQAGRSGIIVQPVWPSDSASVALSCRCRRVSRVAEGDGFGRTARNGVVGRPNCPTLATGGRAGWATAAVTVR